VRCARRTRSQRALRGLVLGLLLAGCTTHHTTATAGATVSPAVASPLSSPGTFAPANSSGVAAAVPPCMPPDFSGPLLTGTVIGLGENQPASSPVKQNESVQISVGERVVLTLGLGCDSAATFTVAGPPVAISGHDPAPLPGSGDNAVQVTAIAPRSAIVHIHNNRACITDGPAKGMCFGSSQQLPDVRFIVSSRTTPTAKTP
jgi:hypothetical protein